jgi:hypothetical protein
MDKWMINDDGITCGDDEDRTLVTTPRSSRDQIMEGPEPREQSRPDVSANDLGLPGQRENLNERCTLSQRSPFSV